MFCSAKLAPENQRSESRKADWLGRQDLTWGFIPFCVNSGSLWQEGQGRTTPFCVAGDVLGNFGGKAHPHKQTKQGKMELKGTTIEVFLSWCAHTHTHDSSVWTVGISQ